MTIRVVSEQDPETWDDYVRRFTSAGPFHTKAWTECFKSERLTPIYLRLFSDHKAIGGIAGMVVGPRMPILRGIDRRISFFSGPALFQMDSALIRDSMLSLNRYARDQGFTSLISSPRDYPYGYDWGDSKVHLQCMEELIIDLSDSWERVRGRMRRSIPEQVRKAERSGLTFDVQRDQSMLPQLLCLLENTRLRSKRKRGAPFSPYYLPHLAAKPLSCLSQSSIARFCVARKDSEVLCVLLVCAFAQRAYALLIGCSDEGYDLRAPAFTWFNAIRSLKAEGTAFLNLAGGNTFAKISLGAERCTCMGCVSPYLKGPVRNLLFQTLRWTENLTVRLNQY